MEDYPRNRFSVRRRVRFSLMFVLGAMLVLAVIRLTLRISDADHLTPRAWGEAFFSVLAYYLLALLSVPVWLRLLHRRVVVSCVVGIPALWAVWLVVDRIVGHGYWNSPLEWARLMLVSKYNYFYMTALVLYGVLIGHLMMRAPDPRSFALRAIAGGGLLLAMGLIIVAETLGVDMLFDRMVRFWTGMLGAQLYVAFTALFLGGAVWFLQRWETLGPAVRFAGKGLILLGGLALPVYVLHELVLPLKELLTMLGLPEGIALALPMGGFFGAIGYGMWRLDRMYFR